MISKDECKAYLKTDDPGPLQKLFATLRDSHGTSIMFSWKPDGLDVYVKNRHTIVTIKVPRSVFHEYVFEDPGVYVPYIDVSTMYGILCHAERGDTIVMYMKKSESWCMHMTIESENGITMST